MQLRFDSIPAQARAGDASARSGMDDLRRADELSRRLSRKNAYDIIASSSRAADASASRRDSRGNRAVLTTGAMPKQPELADVQVQLTPEEAERLRKLRALPEHVKVGGLTE